MHLPNPALVERCWRSLRGALEGIFEVGKRFLFEIRFEFLREQIGSETSRAIVHTLHMPCARGRTQQLKSFGLRSLPTRGVNLLKALSLVDLGK